MSERIRIGICGDLRRYEELAEIGFDYMDVFGRDMVSLSDEEFSDLAAAVKAGKMPCRSICRYCTPALQLMGDNYDAEKTESYARALCSRASRLGMAAIGIGAGASRTVPEGYPLELAEEQLCEALGITARVAGEYGMKLMLEPLNSFECNHLLSTASVAEFIDRINMDNVGMVFDFHHASIMGETESDYLPYIPYMQGVHFNEVDYETDAKLFLREESFETYKSWLKSLVDKGYEGPFTIEALASDDLRGDTLRSFEIVRRLKAEL